MPENSVASAWRFFYLFCGDFPSISLKKVASFGHFLEQKNLKVKRHFGYTLEFIRGKLSEIFYYIEILLILIFVSSGGFYYSAYLRLAQKYSTRTILSTFIFFRAGRLAVGELHGSRSSA